MTMLAALPYVSQMDDGIDDSQPSQRKQRSLTEWCLYRRTTPLGRAVTLLVMHTLL